MSQDITPDRIERLKRQVPPGVSPEAWGANIDYMSDPRGSRREEITVDRYLLGLVIADADAREAAEPKQPPIPPCPDGVFVDEWREFFGALRGILNDTHLVAAVRTYKLADYILAALEAYRPGVEMVPIEAFVEYRPEYERPERPWLAIEANRKLTWHPDKPSALAAVRESVRKVMAEREAADE